MGATLCNKLNSSILMLVFYLFSADNLDPDGRIYVTLSSTVPSMSEVCNVTDNRTVGEYLLLVKKGKM